MEIGEERLPEPLLRWVGPRGNIQRQIVRILILAALLCASTILAPARASAAIFGGSFGSGDGTQSFAFSGYSQGGFGSAKMDITVTEAGGITTVVADLWNTSPTTYGSGQPNVSGITGFGFDIAPNTPVLTYSLYAQQWNGSSLSPVLLGDTDPEGNLWNLAPGGSGQFQANLFADNGTGIAEGLYNPELAGNPALGNTNPYFTGARLTITFEGSLMVVWGYDGEPSCEDNGVFSTPIIRMQRVGDGGSLKLEPELPTFLNPEPHSLVVWALAGGAGLLFALRRRKAYAATA